MELKGIFFQLSLSPVSFLHFFGESIHFHCDFFPKHSPTNNFLIIANTMTNYDNSHAIKAQFIITNLFSYRLQIKSDTSEKEKKEVGYLFFGADFHLKKYLLIVNF